ncbi:MAG: GNAT family N-acetyltransferase [Acidobacteria bacterium]|nr:GNAT family N-acetyltransferase [Acidobacteriota bacterium]
MVVGRSPQTFFAIERAGQVGGGIGYSLHGDVERAGAELGYWIAVSHWGHGIATAAVRAVTEYAFTTHPDLRRVWAVPFASNPASARVLEKAGFVLEGTLRESVVKDGRVLDLWMYSILRRDLG